MTEAKFQSLFNRWLRHNWDGDAAAFELKITKANSDVIAFSQVEEHQEQALVDCETGMLVYKIADDSAGFKPFDSFVMQNTPGYLVLTFYKPRAKKFAYMIRIGAWQRFKGDKKRGSINEDQASQIAERAIDLNDITHDGLDNLTDKE